MKHCGTVFHASLIIALVIPTVMLGLHFTLVPALSASVPPPAQPALPAGAGTQTHDLAIESCVAEGTPMVELSDTDGAVMYVACDFGNLSDHDELVEVTSGDELLRTTLPNGCVADGSLLIPGRVDFVMTAGEVKRALYRVTFECHAPAAPSVTPLVIEARVEHVAQADGIDDSNPDNNALSPLRSLLTGPAPTATPPPPDADGDGDGFINSTEAHIGTLANEPCGSDGWPADLVETGLSFNRLDVQDMTSFIAPVRRLGSSPGEDDFDKRWDLVPGSPGGAHISNEDMAALMYGPTGYPPMFDGQRAFNRTCPSAP